MIPVSLTREFTRVALFLVLSLSLGMAAEPKRAPLAMKNPVQDKNFYFLSAIESTPTVRGLVKSSRALSQAGEAKRAALAAAMHSCATDVSCYAKALRWSDDEIAQTGAAIGALGNDPAMRTFVAGPMLDSGWYQRYSQQPPAGILEHAWADAARKMNIAIDVYALGKPGPHGFDGPAYDVKTPEFGRTVQLIGAVIENDPAALELFFEPTMHFATELLRAQLRDEAARNEPLEAGENRAAVQRVATLNWAQFPYTVIVVLGQGPDRAGVPLSPGGRLRLVPAVKAYRDGKAPYILVSGGYVHPPLTPYSEALEMKKSLMAEFGVPENAIFVDPQARITVTNMRNAARLMYRYRIPFDRKGLVMSSPNHIDSVEKADYRDNLGYMPYRAAARISPFALEFVPNIESLNVDLADLMDP